MRQEQLIPRLEAAWTTKYVRPRFNHPNLGFMNLASRTRIATSISESESRYVKHVIAGNTASMKLNKCITNFSISRYVLNIN